MAYLFSTEQSGGFVQKSSQLGYPGNVIGTVEDMQTITKFTNLLSEFWKINLALVELKLREIHGKVLAILSFAWLLPCSDLFSIER